MKFTFNYKTLQYHAPQLLSGSINVIAYIRIYQPTHTKVSNFPDKKKKKKVSPDSLSSVCTSRFSIVYNTRQWLCIHTVASTVLHNRQ